MSYIRKAQRNEETVLGVFFDAEKAFDMMRKEELLIKTESDGNKGTNIQVGEGLFIGKENSS